MESLNFRSILFQAIDCRLFRCEGPIHGEGHRFTEKKIRRNLCVCFTQCTIDLMDKRRCKVSRSSCGANLRLGYRRTHPRVGRAPAGPSSAVWSTATTDICEVILLSAVTTLLSLGGAFRALLMPGSAGPPTARLLAIVIGWLTDRARAFLVGGVVLSIVLTL